MKLILIILSLIFVLQSNIYSFDKFFYYGLINFNTNHITSINNTDISSNHSLSLYHNKNRRFTHIPDGTQISKDNMRFARFGISINKFPDITEYRFMGELININAYSYIVVPMIAENNTTNYYDSKDLDNIVIYGGLKVLRFNNDIFRKMDYEWIKLHFGKGLNLLNSNLNIIIPSIFLSAGYSTFKPEKRNAQKLLKFRNNEFSGLDLELGAKINIEYKNLDVNGTFSYRRILEINPHIEIFQNHLKIGYSYYLTIGNQGIDCFIIDKYKAFSIYFIGNYDLLKVNSLIQENPSIGIQIEINP